MMRGIWNPLAYSSTLKPAGTCRLAPLGGEITCVLLLAEGVANGGGNFAAICCQANAAPTVDRASEERRIVVFFMGLPYDHSTLQVTPPKQSTENWLLPRT